nr:orf135 [Trichoplusia ni single nucleopolyhedrovirus]
MSTLRNKCLIRSIQILEKNYRRVSVGDLKKISEAMAILQESNTKLTRTLQKMSSYYAERYKNKIQNLQNSIDKKDRHIKDLYKQIDEKNQRGVFIVRFGNSVCFFSSLESLNKTIKQSATVQNLKIILYRGGCDIKSDRSVCMAIAKAKYKNYVSIENRKIVFVESADADSFELDIKQMLT